MRLTTTRIRAACSELQATPGRLLEIPALVAVILATAALSIASSDLVLYDETAYLRAGLDVGNAALPGFSGGATYVDLYFLLSRLTQDPVGLYFAGRVSSAVLLVLGVWLSARILTRRTLAWVAAAVVAMTPAPYVWPGVSAPAAALVLVALSVVFRFSTAWALGVGAGLVWLAAGARPELAWVACVWSVIALAQFAWSTRTGRDRSVSQAAISLAGSLGIPLLLMLLHGNPFNSGGREWIAFQQHFSLRHASSGLDPWTDSGTITAQTFGDASSVSEALAASPSAFVGHVLANVLEAPNVLVRQVLGVSPGSAFLLGALSVGVLALSLVVSLLSDPRGARTRLGRVLGSRSPRSSWGPWIVLGSVCLSILASVSIVYPREHYLLLPAAGAIVLLLSIQTAVGTPRWESLLPVLAVMLVFVAFTAQVVRLSLARVAYPAPFAATVIRMIESGRDWRLLGGGQLLDTYLPTLVEISNAQVLPEETFAEMLDRENINVVLSGATETSPWSGAPGFQQFFDDPTLFGFDSPFPGSQVWIR